MINLTIISGILLYSIKVALEEFFFFFFLLVKQAIFCLSKNNFDTFAKSNDLKRWL